MRFVLPVAAAVLLAFVPLISAGETKGLWEGFGEGSWVTNKSTVKMTMPGMPSE